MGIVDDGEFALHLQASEVLFVVGQKYLKAFRRHFIGSPVKGVMKSFGDVEEVVAAGDHVPADGQAQFLEYRDQAG